MPSKIPTSFDAYSEGYDRALSAQQGGWTTADAEERGFTVSKSGEFLGAGRTADMYKNGVQHPMPYDPTKWGKPNGDENRGFGRRDDDLEEMLHFAAMRRP